MSARTARVATATLLCVACTQQPSAAALPDGAPVEELLAQCEEKDGWSDPAPPVRLFGNIYQVGSCGIVALLIVGSEGNILIDTGPADAAALVLANIERLGFARDSVKWVLTSHPHSDHVGGLAEILQLTGASLAASAAARPALENGGHDPADPQAGLGDSFDPVKVTRILTDGETLELGNVAIALHATPGHTPGSTSWSWRACEGDVCHKAAYVDSVTAISDDTYRYSDHPDYVATFRASLDRIAGLDCDLLITPHPGASTLFERLAGDAPLAAPGACAYYADWGREGLETRLESEK